VFSVVVIIESRTTLPISANIKESAGRVIRASTKSISIGEELNGVNIGFVTRKCFNVLLVGTNVEHLQQRIGLQRQQQQTTTATTTAATTATTTTENRVKNTTTKNNTSKKRL